MRQEGLFQLWTRQFEHWLATWAGTGYLALAVALASCVALVLVARRYWAVPGKDGAPIKANVFFALCIPFVFLWGCLLYPPWGMLDAATDVLRDGGNLAQLLSDYKKAIRALLGTN